MVRTKSRDEAELIAEFGAELYRYLSPTGRLLSVRSNGFVIGQTWDNQVWRRMYRKKPEVPLADWMKTKAEKFAALPNWAKNVEMLPSLRDLRHWASDGVAETVTGETVEPDGHGEDGAPSWLLALGLM